MSGDLGRQLWEARRDGLKLAADTPGWPEGETAGYAMQAKMIAASGHEVVGWKIGATAEALFPVLGVTQPFFGPLFADYVWASGAEVAIEDGRSIETEITLRLGADLPHRETPYDTGAIDAAVAAVVPSFEIVGARFEGGLAGAGHRIIADGGANVGTVLGDDVEAWRDFDLVDRPIELFLDGASAVQGSTSALLWAHVLDAVAWLARQPAMAPRGLKAGDLVMTGTCTGITPIAKGMQARASFGDLGGIDASFV